jgi:hypothetical protein
LGLLSYHYTLSVALESFMKSSPVLFRGRTFFRLLLLLLAADNLLTAGVVLHGAEALLEWLGLPATAAEAPHDRELLLRLLGVLALVHSGVLVILVRWPEDLGPLALVPLLGRLIGVGLWLWVWATPRLHLAPGPPLLLALHDAVWLPGLVWFLFAWRRWRAVS